MEHSSSSSMFPLNFYCRNARLCMKKAAFSKKAYLFADELLHLRKFHTLVTATIPAHPQFEDQKTEKQIVELQTYVTETRKRIQQLETEQLAISKPKEINPKTRRATPRTSNNNKPNSLPSFSMDLSSSPSARKYQKMKSKTAVSRKQIQRKQQQEWQEEEEEEACWPLPMLHSHGHGEADHEQESPSASSSLSPLLKHDFDVSSSIHHHLQPFALLGERRHIDNNNVRDSTAGSSAHPLCQRSGLPHHHVHWKENSKCPPPLPVVDQSGLYLDVDENGEVTDAASIDPGDQSFHQKKDHGFPRNQQSREQTFPDHHGGTRRAESQHMDWFRSKNRPAEHEDLAMASRLPTYEDGPHPQQATRPSSTAEAVHGVRMALRGEQQRHAEEDGSATNMSTKLKEEYDKLKEQMKWLKRKEASPHRETGGTMDRQKKQAYNTQPNIVGSSHGNHADDHQRKQRRDHANHASHHENSSFDEKTRLNRSPSKLPPTPSSFNASLPFSHYISKLKQLVPDHGSPDISLPLHPPLSCNTQMMRQGCPLYEPAAADMAHVCSPSSSDTFAESLTYSNPVFDLEGEQESPEWKDTKPKRKSGNRIDRRTAFEDDRSDDEQRRYGAPYNADNQASSLDNHGRKPQLTYENASSFHVLEKLKRDLASKLIHREDHSSRRKCSLPLEEIEQIDDREKGNFNTVDNRKPRSGKEHFQRKQRGIGNAEEAESRQMMVPPDQTVKGGPQLYADRDDFDYVQSDTDENHVELLPDQSFCCSDGDAKEKSERKSVKKTQRSAPDNVLTDAKGERCLEGNAIRKRTEEGFVPVSDNTVDVFRGEHNWLQSKLQQIEQDLKDHKLSYAREQEAMRGYLDHAMQLLLEKDDQKHNSFDSTVERFCEERLKSMQEQMDNFLEKLKQTMTKEMREDASAELQVAKDAWKGEMEAMERTVSNNVQALRSELVSSIDEVRSEQQLERSSHASSSDRDAAIAKMQEELRIVWKEIQQLRKGKEECRDQIGKLTRIAEEAGEYINKESNSLSQKQLQHLRNECMRSKKSGKEMKKEVEEIREILEGALAKMREEAERLRRLEEGFRNECANVAEAHKQMMEANEAMKQQVQMVEAMKEELQVMERSRTNQGFFLERIEHLSHFYHCALEAVREDLHHVKLVGQGRLDEIEFRWEEFLRNQQDRTLPVASPSNSLHNLVLDGLESRILHVETALGNNQELKRAQYRVDTILDAIEKDQESASAAAAKAGLTVQKADEVLEALQAELQNTVANNFKFREDLQMEKQAITVACSEIQRVKAVLIEEKELALVAASEAKKRSFEIWEGLQEDMMNLKNSLMVIEKNKEVASTAASEATAAAARAEKALEEVSKTCEESCAIYNFTKTSIVSIPKEGTHDEVNDRMEELVAAIGKVIQNTAELDEQHKKQESFLHDIGKEVVATSAEQKGLVERITDMCSKVQKLENTLGGLSLTIEQVRSSAVDMEKASTKHENAVATILTQLEKRIQHLENPFHAENPSEDVDAGKQEIDASMEKQQLLNLYKEMSCFFKKLQMESEEGDGGNETCHNQKAFNALQLRVGELENRIYNVETATTLTTRTLESRMHFFDAQVQAALAAAMTAEGKCSVLGAELVKVFRALASNKKESIPKSIPSEDNNEHQIEKKIDTVSRVKAPATTHHAACNSCKKGSVKSPPVPADVSTKENAKSETNLKEKRDMNILKIEGQKLAETPEIRSGSTCTLHTNTSSGHSHYTNSSPMDGYTDPAQMMLMNEKDVSVVKMGRKISLNADAQAHNQNSDDFGAPAPVKSSCNGDAMMDVVRTQNSKMVILEGKLPITQGRLSRRRIECATKENIHVGSASRNYQMTDIRLDGGRIFVNVSHRSAFISGTRLVKQGDTFTVKTEAC